MNLDQLIESRYSLRDYSNSSVSDELLEKVVNAGRLAPSAANKQPCKFYVVRSEDTVKQIKKSYLRSWIQAVPAIIVVVGLHDESWKRASDMKDHVDIDCSIAIDHMTLKATDLGLGTCWVCNFDIAKIRSVLNLLHSEEPIALLPIGFPANEIEQTSKNRKSMETVSVWL